MGCGWSRNILTLKQDKQVLLALQHLQVCQFVQEYRFYRPFQINQGFQEDPCFRGYPAQKDLKLCAKLIKITMSGQARDMIYEYCVVIYQTETVHLLLDPSSPSVQGDLYYQALQLSPTGVRSNNYCYQATGSKSVFGWWMLFLTGIPFLYNYIY